MFDKRLFYACLYKNLVNLQSQKIPRFYAKLHWIVCCHHFQSNMNNLYESLSKRFLVTLDATHVNTNLNNVNNLCKFGLCTLFIYEYKVTLLTPLNNNSLRLESQWINNLIALLLYWKFSSALTLAWHG